MLRTSITCILAAAVSSCSVFVGELLDVPGSDVRYIGSHDSSDVALLVATWKIALETHTGEVADIDGTHIEERTLSEELDGYLSNTGAVVVASKPSVSSMAIMHELTHQHLRRSTGDADVDHASGDGPWLEEHDEIIADATDVIRRCGL